jgi:hypothetical protein
VGIGTSSDVMVMRPGAADGEGEADDGEDEADDEVDDDVVLDAAADVAGEVVVAPAEQPVRASRTERPIVVDARMRPATR